MKRFAKKGDSAKYKERRCHELAVNNGEDVVRLCDLKNVKDHHTIKGVVRHG